MPQVLTHPRSNDTIVASASALQLTSPAFVNNAVMPVRYTHDGANLSPPLAWTFTGSSRPAGPKIVSFALVCDDPDAPAGTFTHWLVWNVDPAATSLAEGASHEPTAAAMQQGRNDMGTLGWAGPSPPKGPHHRYVFHLYALDTRLQLPAGARRQAFEHAIASHVLDEATLIAKYGRS